MDQAKTKSVLLLQDLTLEGWKSMDIYAAQLKSRLPLVDNRYRVTAPSDYSTLNPAEGRLTGQFQRFYSRYVTYPALLRHYDGDIIHILDHSYAHLLRGRDPCRVIITVHDLFPLHSIANSGRSMRARARAVLLGWVMKWCKRATLLVADSDFTRHEIVQLMNYTDRRIRTVPLGVDEHFFATQKVEQIKKLQSKLRLPDGPILLHVGTCVERKNIYALFGVLARLRKKGHKAHLLQVGGHFTPTQKAEIDKLDLTSHVTQLHRATDEELPIIYRLADLLLFPSTYEGFGLPVLEAMACGTAVVGAHAASIPELTGDAALLAGPNDWDGLALEANRVISDSSLRSELIMKGRERAANFTWTATARNTVAVYDELIDLNFRG
jgi:glycosyltransferase involved in cell wall biosynthesis